MMPQRDFVSCKFLVSLSVLLFLCCNAADGSDKDEVGALSRVVALAYNDQIVDVSAGAGVDEALFVLPVQQGASLGTFTIFTELCRDRGTELLVLCPEPTLQLPSDMLVKARLDKAWERAIAFKVWQDIAPAASVARASMRVRDNFNQKFLSNLRHQLEEGLSAPQGPRENASALWNRSNTELKGGEERQRPPLTPGEIAALRRRIAACEQFLILVEDEDRHRASTIGSSVGSSGHVVVTGSRREVSKSCSDMTDDCWQAAHFSYTSTYDDTRPPPLRHGVLTGIAATSTDNADAVFVYDPSVPSAAELASRGDIKMNERQSVIVVASASHDEYVRGLETEQYSARLRARISEPRGIWRMKVNTNVPHESFGTIQLAATIVPQTFAMSYRFLFGLIGVGLVYMGFGAALLAVKYCGIRARQALERRNAEQQLQQQEVFDRMRRDWRQQQQQEQQQRQQEVGQQEPQEEVRTRQLQPQHPPPLDRGVADAPVEIEELREAEHREATAQHELFDEDSERAPLARLQSRVVASFASGLVRARVWWGHQPARVPGSEDDGETATVTVRSGGPLAVADEDNGGQEMTPVVGGDELPSNDRSGSVQQQVAPREVDGDRAPLVSHPSRPSHDQDDERASLVARLKQSMLKQRRDTGENAAADGDVPPLADSRDMADSLNTHPAVSDNREASVPSDGQPAAASAGCGTAPLVKASSREGAHCGSSKGSGSDAADEDEDMCRICRCAEPTEELFAPCQCRGSSKFVHRSCLRQWRAMTTNPHHKTHCAECKTPYIVEVAYESPKELLMKILRAMAGRFGGLVVSIAALMASGYVVKLLAFITTFDDPRSINWSITHSYHWLLGASLLCAISITIASARFFIMDYPTFGQQLRVLVMLSTLPIVGFGYVGKFIFWVFNGTVWTWEVSFGVGVWIALLSYNYFLPSWQNTVEQLLSGTEEVVDRGGDTFPAVAPQTAPRDEP